jgi:hypothetical protein
MSDPTRSFIEAEIAGLAQIVPIPQPPFGWGTDLWCMLDLSPTMADVDPMNAEQAIGQALIRRLITPRGSLLDDGNYGLDLRGMCNRGITSRELASLSDQIRNECRKDDRTQDVTPTVTWSFSTSVLTVSLKVTPVDQAVGNFSLTFAVDRSGTEFLKLLG